MAIAVPNLPSSDLSVAKAFYVGKLGFNVVFEETRDGVSGILGLVWEGARINIDSPMEGHGRKACVSIEVNDVDPVYAEWSAALELTDEPQDQTWGARTFAFQDPDDNTVFIVSPVEL